MLENPIHTSLISIPMQYLADPQRGIIVSPVPHPTSIKQTRSGPPSFLTRDSIYVCVSL